MVSSDTETEIEDELGRVPSWIDAIAEPASDHSWRLVRDLLFGETELTPREKGLVGVGAAAAINCPYCTHFHKEEARMAEATEDELTEAVTLASNTRYFSTVLHGSETDLEAFVEETDEIVAYFEEQEAAAADD
ncbi:carboxymuconolactone decarboxylase family protein [Natronococcus occultus]|uniref:Alkylhydroperoxidase AhpD family core domain protein n=1 Tax=Natronococcus occultus SP4 TaxID=694430 RepID=L0K454_9EURY|nr:carboxymuconolactone decarboxylase family protein [Natronococcus occultus]AGB39154.1 alkylhydroperoxidase AhpD family core domain protein [Natronococcus occultus SP4]